MKKKRSKLKKRGKQNRVNIMDIPEGKSPEDYPKNTVFVCGEHEPAQDDVYWEDDWDFPVHNRTPDSYR